MPRKYVNPNTGKRERIRIVPSTVCGKYTYAKRKVAAQAAAAARKATGEEIYAYKCQRGCFGHHIGHVRYSEHKRLHGIEP